MSAPRTHASLRRPVRSRALPLLLLAGLLPLAQPVGAASAHTGDHGLVVSTSPSREPHGPLEGAELDGQVHIFTDPGTNVKSVTFRLDDPTRSKPPFSVEGAAPYDFAGTAEQGAKPFDVSTLPAGSHSVLADVEYFDGRKTAFSATFTRPGSTTPSTGPAAALRVSTSSSRSAPSSLDGATVSGPAYVFVEAAQADVERIDLYLDDPEKKAAPRTVERWAPFDLGGTAADGGGTPLPPLANGTHTVLAVVTGPKGVTEVKATFTVALPTSSGTYVYTEEPRGGGHATEAQGVVLGNTLYQFSSFDGSRPCCFPTELTYKYDYAAKKWSNLPAMPTVDGGRGGVTHAGVTTDGRLIYLAGGYVHTPDSKGILYGTDKVWTYDTWMGKWQELPWKLPVKIASGQIALLNGRLHYFGGHTFGERKDTPRHFAISLSNPSAGWTELAPMPLAVNHMGAQVIGGKIYAVGGQTGFDATSVMRGDLQVYDPATNTWSVKASMKTPRSHITSSTFVLGGKLVVAGGENETAPYQYANTGEVSQYDPATDTWTTLSPLPEPRRSGVAGALPEGRWIYAGGSSDKVWSATPSS